MPKLFETTTINGLSLANRFIRTATWDGLAAADGAVTPAMIELLVRLARSGLGLVITGHAYVLPEGQGGSGQLGAYKDELTPGLKSLAGAVHQAGGKIALQVNHCGLMALSELTGCEPVGPSPLSGQPGRAMNQAEIKAVVQAFTRAAERGVEAGFDAVQVHAAHGFLLSEFLSPAFNKRTDNYGGPIENRARLAVETIEAIRAAVGRDYPILIKVNSQDYLDGGLSLEESVRAGELLAAAGVDAFEMSGGTVISGDLRPARTGIDSEEKEAYFKEAALAFKASIDRPIILVGGHRSIGAIERLAAQNAADYIGLGRPLIREPDLVSRWRAGDRSRAACISCNQCFDAAGSAEGLYCVAKRRLEEKAAGGG